MTSIKLPPKKYEKIKPRWMPCAVWQIVKSWYPASWRLITEWQELDRTIISPGGKRYKLTGHYRFTTPEEQWQDYIDAWNRHLEEAIKDLANRQE